MCTMTRRRLLLLSLLGIAGTCVVLAVVAALQPGLRTGIRRLVERPDPAVIAVSTEADLRAAFNARPNTTRIVAFLSPT